MSFSSETKKELAQMIPEKKCCIMSEIAGYSRLNGSIRLLGGGHVNVVLTFDSPAVARVLKRLISAYFRTGTSIRVVQGSAFGRVKKYMLTFDDPEAGERMLLDAGMVSVENGHLSLKDAIDRDIIKKKCCRKAYLRGLFLAGGSVSHPEKGYHLEIVSESDVIANDIKKLMNTFSLNAKVTGRKGSFVTYIKESEHIVDFMNITGAHSQLLEFENVRILKQMRNEANRIVNCENANVDKSVDAAARQLENIRFIQKTVGLNKLPDKLRDAAELRLNNPELPLRELAMLSDDKVSKSGMNHRLKKIDDIAERLRNGSTAGLL